MTPPPSLPPIYAYTFVLHHSLFDLGAPRWGTSVSDVKCVFAAVAGITAFNILCMDFKRLLLHTLSAVVGLVHRHFTIVRAMCAGMCEQRVNGDTRRIGLPINNIYVRGACACATAGKCRRCTAAADDACTNRLSVAHEPTNTPDATRCTQ